MTLLFFIMIFIYQITKKMKTEHINFINYIEGIKTCLKNTHWASENNSEHIRMDEFADIVSDFEDSISEEFQGIEGQIKDNEVKPIEYTFSNVKNLLQDINSKTMELYDSLENDKTYIGVKSEIESFVHNINKYAYLFKLSLKDDTNNTEANKESNDTDENNNVSENTIKLTHEDLKNIIKESVKYYLNNI